MYILFNETYIIISTTMQFSSLDPWAYSDANCSGWCSVVFYPFPMKIILFISFIMQ